MSGINERLETFKKEETLKAAESIKEFGKIVFYVANAALTACYAVAVVLMSFFPKPPVSYDTVINTINGLEVEESIPVYEPYNVGAMIGIALLCIVASSLAVLLTDGARFYWEKARYAYKSRTAQQNISLGMEIISFILSLSMSVIALRVLISLTGIAEISNIERSHMVMIYILSGALTANMIAAWLSDNLSAEKRQLHSLASAYASLTDTTTATLKMMFENVKSTMPEVLDEYIPEITEAHIVEMTNNALKQLGHRQIGQLKERVKPDQPQITVARPNRQGVPTLQPLSERPQIGFTGERSNETEVSLFDLEAEYNTPRQSHSDKNESSVNNNETLEGN